jgi:hypothetical protein
MSSSVLVSYMVDDAARAIGDPNKTRVSNADWTSFFNRSARELCEKANVLQYRSIFNLGTQALYPYPDEMVVLSRIEINETPTNDDTWRPLDEKFEDEFRSLTTNTYPTGTVPDSYFSDQGGFYLIPRPAAALADAGRMIFFGLPDRISDVTTATFQLIDIAQDYVTRRMIVYGLKARNRHVEAQSELAQWFTDVEGLQDKLEDRSHDRRSSLRPRRAPMFGMR